jgi:hypothetical protein
MNAKRNGIITAFFASRRTLSMPDIRQSLGYCTAAAR